MNLSVTAVPILMLCIVFVRALSDIKSCQRGLKDDVSGHTWTLCITKSTKTTKFEIVNLYTAKRSGILAIGFPIKGGKSVKFFGLRVENEAVSIIKKGNLDCHLETHENVGTTSVVECKMVNNTYLDHKSVEIYYSTSQLDDGIDSDAILKKHESLTFNFDQIKSLSRVTKFAKQYGKSMAAIVGIAVLLTTLITLFICCCCKPKQKLGMDKLKPKDVSVAFYKDREGEGESDSSETDDENVAFINSEGNERNSNV